MSLISDIGLIFNYVQLSKTKNVLSKINFGGYELSVCLTGWCDWVNYFLGPLDVDCELNICKPTHTLTDETLQKYKQELGLPFNQLSCSV